MFFFSHLCPQSLIVPSFNLGDQGRTGEEKKKSGWFWFIFYIFYSRADIVWRESILFLLPRFFFSDLHPPSFLCILRYIFTTDQGRGRRHIEHFAFIGEISGSKLILRILRILHLSYSYSFTGEISGACMLCRQDASADKDEEMMMMMMMMIKKMTRCTTR